MKIIELQEAIMYHVYSSNLSDIGWENNELDIEFLSGSLYRYYNVPKRIYTNMLSATSKGKYFWRHVRGKFEYERIN